MTTVNDYRQALHDMTDITMQFAAETRELIGFIADIHALATDPNKSKEDLVFGISIVLLRVAAYEQSRNHTETLARLNTIRDSLTTS